MMMMIHDDDDDDDDGDDDDDDGAGAGGGGGGRLTKIITTMMTMIPMVEVTVVVPGLSLDNLRCSVYFIIRNYIFDEGTVARMFTSCRLRLS